MQIVHVPTAGKTIEGVLEFAIKITEKNTKIIYEVTHLWLIILAHCCIISHTDIVFK